MRVRIPLATGHLIALFGATLLLALIASLGVSVKLAHRFSEEIRGREINLAFGSIEAGPLALARLHSGAIAQAELTRLMGSPELLGRSIYSAQIQGGEARSLNFATWQSRESVPDTCLQGVERKFDYADSLHPFWIALKVNHCTSFQEESHVYRSTISAVVMVCFVVALSLLLAATPVVRSLTRAQELIQGENGETSLESIPFLPLRALAALALKSRNLERDAALAHLAQQVAHDIRSPLSALHAALNDQHFTEDSRLLVRNAIRSIREIADGLLRGNREQAAPSGPASSDPASETEPHAESLPLLLEKVIVQKHAQYRARGDVDLVLKTDPTSYGIFASIQPIELERIVSNLVNNSVEAAAGNTVVNVTLKSVPGFAIVEVRDNGHGIPADLLPRLAQRGVTAGKSGGTGLGLFHAKAKIESWRGTFEIESSVGHGTTVRLSIPIADPPAWFARSVSVDTDSILVVADDDPSIHVLWDRRLDEAGIAKERRFHAHSIHEVVAWYRSNLCTDAVYLMDFDFGSRADNGLDLIERLGVGITSILVTNRADDTAIRARCERFGIQILPKQLLGIVPVRTCPRS